jgi:hypothetical protein
MNLFFYSGKTDENIQVPIQVYRQENLSFSRGWLVSVQIIGYSHIIIFYRQGEPVYQEILSSRLRDPGNSSLRINLQRPSGKILLRENDLGWIESKTLEEREVTIFHRRARLEHTFADRAITAINWRVSSNQIEFNTLHTYPEYKLSVWTKTGYFLTFLDSLG